LLSDESPPCDIARLPRPIIGYSGLISKRLDLDLLEYIAIKHSEWSIVLIGATDERWCVQQLTRLKQMKNIYFLGLKDVKEVPYYVKEFDVCLVPYVIDKETENLSPLKLYDFMATGKPIVTTDFPTAHEFKDIVYIAVSKENCTCRIEEALLEPRNGLFTTRRHTAALNTWEHRINQLSGLLETSLKDKQLRMQ
jgi:glycosyltransferase involved in cell wall biosynthesis